jgi:hypothetical protein
MVCLLGMGFADGLIKEVSETLETPQKSQSENELRALSAGIWSHLQRMPPTERHEQQCVVFPRKHMY